MALPAHLLAHDTRTSSATAIRMTHAAIKRITCIVTMGSLAVLALAYWRASSAPNAASGQRHPHGPDVIARSPQDAVANAAGQRTHERSDACRLRIIGAWSKEPVRDATLFHVEATSLSLLAEHSASGLYSFARPASTSGRLRVTASGYVDWDGDLPVEGEPLVEMQPKRLVTLHVKSRAGDPVAGLECRLLPMDPGEVIRFRTDAGGLGIREQLLRSRKWAAQADGALLSPDKIDRLVAAFADVAGELAS